MKNSNAIFQAGKARLRVKHAVFDYEIQTKAAESGLLRLMAAALEKNQRFFSSCLIIMAVICFVPSVFL